MIFSSIDNSYVRLPAIFYERVLPSPLSNPKLISLNVELCHELGIDPAYFTSDDGLKMLSGAQLPSTFDPIACRYGGHQFGYYNSDLGDGRALLLGEIISPNQRRFDIHLKGSGKTPFSRAGDGRSALGPVLREYMLSEAMHALGIASTRALACVCSDDNVIRERILPAGILLRIASSHIRIGTFQYFAWRDQIDNLQILSDYVIKRHYPNCAQEKYPLVSFMDELTKRHARLVAQWLHIGFIHGVLNTDNVSIAGETLDYGPCAFMDDYNPNSVFSSIDRMGRYAYKNQPSITQWNLERFAECMLLLTRHDQHQQVAVREALSRFKDYFQEEYIEGFKKKLGLRDRGKDDGRLILNLLNIMQGHKDDYTITFRNLYYCAHNNFDILAFKKGNAVLGHYDDFIAQWRQRFMSDTAPPDERITMMRAANPSLIPRNHIVERIINEAQDNKNFAPFHEFCSRLKRPYDDHFDFADNLTPPLDHERVTKTFCGT